MQWNDIQESVGEYKIKFEAEATESALHKFFCLFCFVLIFFLLLVIFCAFMPLSDREAGRLKFHKKSPIHVSKIKALKCLKFIQKKVNGGVKYITQR